MDIIDLGGSDWTLNHDDGRTWPASVPGCAHTDLLAAEVIPDPWYRDNESQIHWVFETDWTWTREVEIPAHVLERANLELVCEGLDTLASVSVNGQAVLSADNMFRTWRADLRSVLKAGTNTISVRVTSPKAMMVAGDERKHLPSWNLYHPDFAGKSYLRKMACSFGWDWGLMAPGAGIWRPIRIEAFDARLEDVRIAQDHSRSDGAVGLAISAEVIGTGYRRATVTVERDGQEVAGATVDVVDGQISVALVVEQAELWWPNGMGDQALYDVTVRLVDQSVETQAEATRRIGLRTLELVREPDEFGESFRFACNGRVVFAKGANWIPNDVWPHRVSDADYADRLGAMADCHMNMIRVWGGGIYELDAFYDCCDEFGILVWQDFAFACSTYPGFDQVFLDNVRAEAIDNVRRLRHRASLALWCGNNELEQGLVSDQGWNERSMSWEDYKPLFDEMLPEVIATEDGVTPYWPCSPHTPGENRAHHNDDSIGDAHAWSVWFGGQPFEFQRTWTYRFMSEFGFQSFPEPRTVASYSEPEDRNLTSWIMDYHQRSAPGNQTIYKYLLDWFKLPKDFDHSLWLTQLSHALCIQYAAEHARRIQGRMDGLLYWQLNDLWPGATWASIDAYGRWKALQFLAKRFFAPVHVSLLEDSVSHQVQVHVSNHRPDEAAVTVHWRVTTCAGRELASGSSPATIASQTDNQIVTIDCQAFAEAGGTTQLPLGVKDGFSLMEGDRDLLVWAWITEDGRELARNLATFAKPKHLHLEQPTINLQVEAGEESGSYLVTCTSDRPAPWTRLELVDADADYSDNWFHLDSTLPQQVVVEPDEDPGLDAVRAQLKAVALVSYWS